LKGWVWIFNNYHSVLCDTLGEAMGFLCVLSGNLSALCVPVGEEIGIYFIISLVALIAPFLDRKDRKGIAKIAKPSLSTI
jgi:hypothetical protein